MSSGLLSSADMEVILRAEKSYIDKKDKDVKDYASAQIDVFNSKAEEARVHALNAEESAARSGRNAESASNSASLAEGYAEDVKDALEQIKGSGDIPAATIAQVAENKADIGLLNEKMDNAPGWDAYAPDFVSGSSEAIINMYDEGTELTVKANGTTPLATIPASPALPNDVKSEGVDGIGVSVIKGATGKWNQIMKNPRFEDGTSWWNPEWENSVEDEYVRLSNVNGATGFGQYDAIVGHKYMCVSEIRAKSNERIMLLYISGVADLYDIVDGWHVYSLVAYAQDDGVVGYVGLACYPYPSDRIVDISKRIGIMCFDLTEMGLEDKVNTTSDFTQIVFGKNEEDVTADEWASLSVYDSGSLHSLRPESLIGKLEDGTTVSHDLAEIFERSGIEELRSVGDVKDEIDLNLGRSVQRVGVKVFDGTEEWNAWFVPDSSVIRLQSEELSDSKNLCAFCTNIYPVSHLVIGDTGKNEGCCAVYYKYLYISENVNKYTDVPSWKQHLADLYAAGTPLVVYYELEEPIITSIPKASAQLNHRGGKNIVAVGMTTSPAAHAGRKAVEAGIVTNINNSYTHADIAEMKQITDFEDMVFETWEN